MLKKQKLNPLDGMTRGFFASNGRQEVDDGHLDEISGDLKTLSVITLYICDIKRASLLNIF